MLQTHQETGHPQKVDDIVMFRENNNGQCPMVHNQYVNHLETYFNSRSDDDIDFELKKHLYETQIHILKHLDLDPAIPILISLYSPGKLKDARDPASMLRALILMTLLRVKSITKWVRLTKHDPFLTVLMGFTPGHAPEVGTYYAFMKRIIDGPYCRACESQDRLKRSDYNAGRHKRNLKNEKQQLKNDFDPCHSKSEKLAEKLLSDAQQPRPRDMYQILEDLHIQLGLIPAIEQGLIEGLHDLVISGDGSTLQTAASGRGNPSCKCRSEGIYRCDHDRYYSSPTAKWCYDHVRDTFIFGDRYYHLVVTQNGHDFPLLTYMPGGNESDYTLSLSAFDRLQKALRENNLQIEISTFIGDGHHDSYAHYRYFEQKNIIPIIPLSKASKQIYPHLPDDGDVRLDADGVPLCPGAVRMRHHCYDKNRQKHVFCCPAKRNTHRNGKSRYVFHEQDCPRKQDCEPQSSIGPFVYLKSSTDPRLFPPLPRSSEKFKQLMNQRSASERCNFINDTYAVEGASRNADYGLIRLTLANIAHHCTIRFRQTEAQKVNEKNPADRTCCEACNPG